MNCRKCGSPCQGALCRHCEIERQFEHLAADLASDDGGDGDD